MSQPGKEIEPPDYRAFDIRGSHAHIGYELGMADPPFAMQFWWAPPPAPAFAAACRDVVHELHSHLIDEFDAYADAQRLPAHELWRQSCRVHLKARVRPEHLHGGADAGREIAEGCSTFAWLGPARTIIGRNYDYLPQQARRQRIRFTPDCCAHASIGARGGVPCGRYDGMNQHGLFVSLHVVMTDTPGEAEVRPGVPFHLVARLALELCATAREAVDMLMRLPHLSSLNYLVADRRDAFVIEADPRRVRVLERDGDLIAATNHYRHPDMRPLQGQRAFANSECRLAFMMRASLEEDRSDGGDSTDTALARAERIMADRSAPMCGLSGALTTLWSCVADLGARRIRYAPGPPSHTAYEDAPVWM